MKPKRAPRLSPAEVCRCYWGASPLLTLPAPPAAAQCSHASPATLPRWQQSMRRAVRLLLWPRWQHLPLLQQPHSCCMWWVRWQAQAVLQQPGWRPQVLCLCFCLLPPSLTLLLLLSVMAAAAALLLLTAPGRRALTARPPLPARLLRPPCALCTRL